MAYRPKPAGPKNEREMFHYIYKELGDVGREIGSIIEGQWQWNDALTGDPGEGYMGSNNVQMDSATELRFSSITSGGALIPPDTLYQPGDIIYVIDEDRAADGRYTIISVDTTNPTYKIFAVTADAGTGNPQQDNIMDVVYIPQATRALNAADIAWIKNRGAP